MSKLALAFSTAVLALSGAALAQPTPDATRAPKADMTRAEAQARAEAMFARMDTNRDGTINEADRADMKAAMFDRLDANGDGAVTQAELAAGHAARAGKHARAKPEGAPAMSEAQKAERAAEMFARIDTDKNGSINRAEMEAMHAGRAGKAGGDAAMGHRRGGKMAAAGPVTRQAFIDGALARFDRADANRDGTLTRAERKAAGPKKRKPAAAAEAAPAQQG